MPASVVALEVGDDVALVIEGEQGDGRLMSELIPGLRELLHAELGVILPGVQLSGGDQALSPSGYRILLSDVPMASGELDVDAVLALAPAEDLQALGIADLASIDAPGVATPCYRVSATQIQALDDAGIQVVDPATQMTLHLGLVVRTYAYEFVGIQETQQLLDGLERTHPALVHEVVPKRVSIQMITDVLRRLVEEGISVRNLREILHALAEWGPTEKDAVVLTEHVRAALRRYISHKYAGEQGQLRAYLLDPAIEDAIRESIQRTPKGSYLAMEPELSRDIVQAVMSHVQRMPDDEALPVVLTNMDIRRYVRRLIETDLPDLSVLSFNELQPAVNVQPIARIGV